MEQAQQAPSQSAERTGNAREGQQWTDDIELRDEMLAESVNDHRQCDSKRNGSGECHEKSSPMPSPLVLDLRESDDFRVIAHSLRSRRRWLSLLAAFFEEGISYQPT
jgi:hypothetical protein